MEQERAEERPKSGVKFIRRYEQDERILQDSEALAVRQAGLKQGTIQAPGREN